ncbi:MAG: hypothetical protein ACE5G8_14450, partial [Anaerolineae bacterium]
MKNFGRTSAGEFLGDRVVYRNLIPVDKRLPPLNVFRDAAGLPPGKIPRKSEPDYAKAIVYLLWQARALESAASRIRRLIFIGDTRLNDGAAFTNICRAANWPGLAFIGSETDAPPAVETAPAGAGQTLYLANRWAALADFDR